MSRISPVKVAVIQGFRELFYLLLWPIDLCVPKDRSRWLFATHENYPWGDNLRTVFERVRERGEIDAVISCSDAVSYERITALYVGQAVTIVRRYSPRGVWAYLRSRVCLIGYTNKDLYSMLLPHVGHVVVNLWHGVSLKAICLARPQFVGRHRKLLNPAYIHADLVIANSHVDRLAMSACMMQNPNHVVVTGLPRNDLLDLGFPLYPDLVEEDRRLKDAKAGRKLALYAPTFRDWDDHANPLAEPAQMDRLVQTLAHRGHVLGVRLHPMERNLSVTDQSGIIDCGGEKFSNVQVVLRNTDLLITDYSSVWVDFLRLERSIFGFCYDEARYGSDRSMLYPLRDVFPGPIANDLEELLGALEAHFDGSLPTIQGPSETTKLLSTFSDSQATGRVIAAIESFAH